MLSLEEFRTSLAYHIDQTEDLEVLNKAYFVLTAPALEMKAKELFSSRGLSTTSADFSFFMNEILPATRNQVSENLVLLDDMIEGRLIDSNYLERSYKTPTSLVDVVDPRLNETILRLMFNHVADSISSSSVGKGEFGFVLLTKGATKPKRGGDLRIGEIDLEIKAKGAKLASQSSHVALMGIKNQVEEEIQAEVKPLSLKNLEEYYLPLMGSVDEVLKFLLGIFNRTMYRAPSGFLDWILEVETFEEFFDKIAVAEFTYYKACDKFDRIIFLNPETLRFYTTDEMDEDQLPAFNLTKGYSFNSERIQTTYWALK